MRRQLGQELKAARDAAGYSQRQLAITDSAVSKHINSIFAKLGLYPGDTGNRRVLAVLRYLGASPASPAT